MYIDIFKIQLNFYLFMIVSKFKFNMRCTHI